MQKQLEDNKVTVKTRAGRKSLLAGILFDETGDRLSPSHAVRSGRRYRYYVSRRLVQARRKDAAGWRLPAEHLEKIVTTFLAELLSDERRLVRLIGHRDPALIRRALDRAAKVVGSGGEWLASSHGLVASVVAKIARHMVRGDSRMPRRPVDLSPAAHRAPNPSAAPAARSSRRPYVSPQG